MNQRHWFVIIWSKLTLQHPKILGNPSSTKCLAERNLMTIRRSLSTGRAVAALKKPPTAHGKLHAIRIPVLPPFLQNRSRAMSRRLALPADVHLLPFPRTLPANSPLHRSAIILSPQPFVRLQNRPTMPVHRQLDPRQSGSLQLRFRVMQPTTTTQCWHIYTAKLPFNPCPRKFPSATGFLPTFPPFMARNRTHKNRAT